VLPACWFGEKRFQPIETLAPIGRVLADPAGDFAKRRRLDGVDLLAAGAPPADKSGIEENGQVLRDRRIGKADLGDQRADGGLAADQNVKDAAPATIGDGMKDIGCGGAAAHT